MMASFPVLAAPQDGGTEDIAFWPGNQSTGLHYSETGKSQSPPTRFQSDEISSSGDELTTKVRKPYTITKQRERWTEEEHQKFLEALKMHGRAWRRIEEHIGTKTAVQIRSHAQKFFSKLERDASARGIPLGKVQDISIPPPRPKRKPSHPYPRKAGTAIQSSSSTVEEGNRSPPTVCSVPDRPSVGLSVGGGTRKSAAFTPYSARTRPLAMNEDVNLQETKMESSSTNSSQSSLKLFGQTVLVPTIVSALGHDIQGAFKEFSSLKQEGSPFECQNPEDQKLENGKGASYTIGQKPQTKALANSRNAPIAASNALSSGSGISMLEGSGESNTNAYCTEKHTGQEDSGDQTDEQPSSELDNNLNSLSREHQAPAAVPGYPRHVPVQYVDASMPEKVHDTLKYGINAVSLGHKFAAMSMLNGNSSLSKASEQLQADIQNSSQLNFILPISGIPGHFNLSSYNNLENFGCIGGFVAPGSCPNGSLPPWHVAQSTVLHHPAYAAASLAATFWPGLASGVTAGTTAEPLGPDDGQNGLTHEETSAAAAITAATVAAASAWWTLHGAVPPPFLHPSIYGPVVATLAAEAAAVAAVTAGNSFHAFKTQPVMAVKKQEQMIASKGEGILDAISVNPHADAEGAVNALQQLDDGKPSKLKTSLCPQADSIDCLPQSSPSGSEHDTISCMEELYDAEVQEGKKNSQTEEHDHKATCTNSSDGEKMINTNFLKERSSSGSNTPSSTDPEMDPYLGTDIEAIKGNNEKDFEFTGIGSGSSEAAIEDALVEEEETKGCTEPETQDEIEGEGNSPSTKQDEKMDNGGKHVHKDRYQGVAGDSVGRRSKCGGHVNDTWKAVSEEGRIAFQALFNRDVLPQSFSPPNNLRGQGLVPKSSSKESFSNDAKQNPRKAPVDEMQADVQDRLANQIKAYNGDVDPQGVCGEEIPLKDAASSTWGKKIQISGATIRDQSLEDFRTSLPPTVSTALDFDKPPKSLAISSFGNFRSGLGFVPYQRCSIDSKKNRLHMRPIQNRADDIRERKRICLKQELEE